MRSVFSKSLLRRLNPSVISHNKLSVSSHFRNFATDSKDEELDKTLELEDDVQSKKIGSSSPWAQAFDSWGAHEIQAQLSGEGRLIFQISQFLNSFYISCYYIGEEYDLYTCECIVCCMYMF